MSRKRSTRHQLTRASGRPEVCRSSSVGGAATGQVQRIGGFAEGGAR